MAKPKKKKNTKRRRTKSEKDSNISTEDQSNSNGIFTASNLGMGLIQFGFTWLFIAVSLKGFILKEIQNNASSNETISNITALNKENIEIQVESLNVSEDERMKYHPVIHFPYTWMKEGDPNNKQSNKKKKVYKYTVLDLTTNDNHCDEELKNERKYSVGKYNEKRNGLYTTPMFQNKSYEVDGYDGERNIHTGIDLFGPVGDKVFAFTDGIVHSAGYNEALGDYGNVIVLEHELMTENGTKQKVWALYGHLNSKSIKGKKVGMRIKKGKMIGRIGDVHENGGWPNPHVHFQLSIHPPDTHDMPGVVSENDREKALLHYPDPRIVLGQLY